MDSLNEKFSKILDMCQQLAVDAMEQDSGNRILKLLDPLVADNQCQIHSLLIFNILNKYYDINTSSYNREKLEEKDKEILSYAVLLTLLKVTHSDTFGLGLCNILSSNFDGLISSKRNEKAFINRIRQKFNSCSIKYIKEVADNKTREVFENHEIESQGVKLKSLPCYASFYTLINNIQKERYPIIISWVEINYEKVGDNKATYEIVDKDVFFYELQGNKFCHKEGLSESYKKRPAIVFLGYSLFDHKNICKDVKNWFSNNERSIREHLKNCDPGHIVMLTAAGHPQLSEKKREVESWECVYKRPGDNVQMFSLDREFCSAGVNSFSFEQYLEAAGKYGSEDARYVTKKGNLVTRTDKSSLLALRHVFVSSYSCEHQRLDGLKANTRLNATEKIDEKRQHGFEVLKLLWVHQALKILKDINIKEENIADVIREKVLKILENERISQVLEKLKEVTDGLREGMDISDIEGKFSQILKILEGEKAKIFSEVLQGKVYGEEVDAKLKEGDAKLSQIPKASENVHETARTKFTDVSAVNHASTLTKKLKQIGIRYE